MNSLENITERFHQLQSANGSSPLTQIERNAFDAFTKMGVPTSRHEEWKYTRISSIFNKELFFTSGRTVNSVSTAEVDAVRLPGFQEANELVFVNGVYSSSLSKLISPELVVLTLEQAAGGEYRNMVLEYLADSNRYEKNGIHALNTAFAQEGLFLHVKKSHQPIYIYHITDARSASILSQPRTLVYINKNVQVQIAENYLSLGTQDTLLNEVLDVVVERDALVEYYKIQNDGVQASQVSTTQFRQIGRSTVTAVTISLNGNIVRNNLNMSLEAEHSEANMFGLYLLKGSTHVDNHTIVDNIKPNCLSNELYKGVIDDKATAVFNGKIYVQPLAQKTNAFQSNKNVLLSDTATVNTKPQLEIFADDVKCSHGCTVGRLDEEGLFYLRSRGIDEDIARSLLVQAFASDIVEHIKSENIRSFVTTILRDRLETATV